MSIFIIFISLLIGHLLLKLPIISIILGIFLIFMLFKNKNKKLIILSLIIISFSLVRMLLLKHDFGCNIGMIIKSKENYFIIFNGVNKYYVYLKNNPYQIFDLLKIKGNISNYNFTNYESQFDFNKYLYDQFVFKKINVSTIEELLVFPIRINDIKQLYLEGFSYEGQTIVSELLFNDSFNENYNKF